MKLKDAKAKIIENHNLRAKRASWINRFICEADGELQRYQQLRFGINTQKRKVWR